MSISTFDVIVIGLGASGSSALYHVAQSGASVLGIDRFVPPHSFGSTHSESRLIRKAYFEGIYYTPLLKCAYRLWNRLEQESSTKLMHLGGCLTIGHKDSEIISNAKKSAVLGNIQHLVLSPDEVRHRFPAYRLQPDQVAVLDLEAGFIQPELCVRAHLKRAASHGAKCLFGNPVVSFEILQNRAIVRTRQNRFECSKVILTTGAWMHDFVEFPMTIERVTNSWFQPTGDNCTPDHCPPFIQEAPDGICSYGCPDMGYGFKVGLHHVGPTVSHPDFLDRESGPSDEAPVRKVLATLIPEAAGTCLKTTVCMYSNLPNERFLIDYYHGNDSSCIVVGSACSGHGFKASSAIGESLAALALDQPPAVDISPFKWRLINESSDEKVF